MWAVLAISLATAASPTPSVQEAAVCKAPPPAVGETLRGPVLHIPGASILCVAKGGDPSQWAPVRLAEPAMTRGRLMSAAFGQTAVCTIGQDGRGACRIEGEALSQRLERADVALTAASWR